MKKEKIKNIIITIVLILLFFCIIEYFLRINALEISNLPKLLITPSSILFILLYITIFLFIIYLLPKRLALDFSVIIHTIYIILFIINYLVLNIKKVPLSISLLVFYQEAVDYISFIKKEINILFILIVLVLIILEVVNTKKIASLKQNQKKIHKKGVIAYLIIILLLLISSELSLNLKLYKNSSFKAKFYHDYHITTSVNGLIALGLTEYINRDIYLTIKSSFDSNREENQDNIKELQEKYHITLEKNEYTGIFKNKNLIMIMLESVDNYVMNEETTPTLAKLRKEGFDFTSRYSYMPLGGSTIHTEYTSMTGIYYDSAYLRQMLKKDYSNSLPSMFHKNHYVTQSMHENTGSYYNRNTLHKNYHFGNSYFLQDISKNVTPYTDAQIVDNDEFYHKIIPQGEDKFMSYIITISAHGPYNQSNSECKGIEYDTECFKMLAKRTDVFVDHLIKRLEEDDLMKDTVLVLYTDHQAYAYDYSEDYLKSLKSIDKKHQMNSIPFIIYAENIEHKTFDDILVNDVDILPTILNLFGIEYDPNYYIGVDIFSKNHKNLLMFNDYTWYDGKQYSLNINSKDYQKYKENDIYITYKMKLNNLYIQK